MLRRHEHDGGFMPCNLKKNIFTITAKDNLDYNA